MHNTNLTPTEQLLLQTVAQHPDLFANGFTDWNKVRYLTIQRCVTFLKEQGERNPIAQACQSNDVNRRYFAQNEKKWQKISLARV